MSCDLSLLDLVCFFLSFIEYEVNLLARCWYKMYKMYNLCGDEYFETWLDRVKAASFPLQVFVLRPYRELRH